MIIKQLETEHFRLPLRTTMTDSMHGDMTYFEVIMVKIITEDGTQGIGYTYTIGMGGTAVKSLIDEAYKPLLIGENPRNIERLWEKMWWQLHCIGRGGLVSFAISAVDIALWDLIGNKDGVPLWQLLGGFSPTVKPYPGGIDLHLDIDGLLDQTQKNLTHGFRAIKMKVGMAHLRKDLERVRQFGNCSVPIYPCRRYYDCPRSTWAWRKI